MPETTTMSTPRSSSQYWKGVRRAAAPPNAERASAHTEKATRMGSSVNWCMKQSRHVAYPKMSMGSMFHGT